MATYYDNALTNQLASVDIIPSTDIPSGQIFYCTSISIAAINNSTTTSGILEILDGGDNGKLKDSLLIPTFVAGGGAGGVAASRVISFNLPLRFSTNVRAKIVAGTLIFGVAASGYFDNSN